MVQSLFDLSLSVVCQYRLFEALADLPCQCKQKLLEYITSHDQISDVQCKELISSAAFGKNLTKINFYLTEQLTDHILDVIAKSARNLQQITLIDCQNITDQGVISITINQKSLRFLELNSLPKLTSDGLKHVLSYVLITVDLSSNANITSDGIYHLVLNNPSIRNLFLNHCKGIDDQALYDIAQCIGPNLKTLELDNASNILHPSISIQNLSEKCPNICQLSLARFFEEIDPYEELEEVKISGAELKDVDLYGNYFLALPEMPPTIRSIRLSVTGQEDVIDMIQRLGRQTNLQNIHLQLICSEEDMNSIDCANRFICTFIPYFGAKITRLHVCIQRLNDAAFSLITQNTPNLIHLALDVQHINMHYIQRFFSGGIRSKGARLRSLKLCRLRITYRALFAIARGAISLTDLETSHMNSVDDRFLGLLADNCKNLHNVNFNGCRWVSDKGMAALAKNCSLKEVRIRGTGCTDKSLYTLAQFCPEVQWIAHADFSGRPKFSDTALQFLRNACIQRVIC